MASDNASRAMDAIEGYRSHATHYADLAHREAELEAERPGQKATAIDRIMTATGKAITPAEKLAETDAEYAAFLATLRDVTRAKQKAQVEAEALRLRAKLHTVMFGEGVIA